MQTRPLRRSKGFRAKARYYYVTLYSTPKEPCHYIEHRNKVYFPILDLLTIVISEMLALLVI